MNFFHLLLILPCLLGQPYIPLLLEPCDALESAPGQYFRKNCSTSHYCVFESAQYNSTCIFSPGENDLLYLAPCNVTDPQQNWNWGGRGEGGFVVCKGGTGCWRESPAPPSGAAGDVIGLSGCGTDQGKFELVTSRNLTQIFSNSSSMCFDTK